MTSEWFWDTPSGGGWARYWRGEFVGIYDRADLERLYPHLAVDADAVMAGWPGKRMPTAAERRAWRKIDPQVKDIGSGDEAASDE